MEYTVIGDSVNLASRMESMTKEYGTDLLIPKVIQERLDGRFVFEQCKSAKVKGKSQAIEIFKVRGYIGEDGKAVLIETPYSSYEAEKSDKVVHDDTHTTAAPGTTLELLPEDPEPIFPPPLGHVAPPTSVTPPPPTPAMRAEATRTSVAPQTAEPIELMPLEIIEMPKKKSA